MRNKRRGVLQTLIDRKADVVQNLEVIAALGDEDAGEFSAHFDKFANAIEAYECAIEATKRCLHAPRARGFLGKSSEKLTKLKLNLRSWFAGTRLRPPELDFCVADIFPTSFFNQELPAFLGEPD